MSNTTAKALPTVQSIEELLTEYYENLTLLTVDKSSLESNTARIKALYEGASNNNRVSVRYNVYESELEELKAKLFNIEGYGRYHVVSTSSSQMGLFEKYHDMIKEGYTVLREKDEPNKYYLFEAQNVVRSFALKASPEKEAADLKYLTERLEKDMHRIAELESDALLDENKATEYAKSKHLKQKEAYEIALAESAKTLAKQKATEIRNNAVAKLQGKSALDVLLSEDKPFYTFDELKTASNMDVDSEVSDVLKGKGLVSKKVKINDKGERAMRWVKKA